MRPFPPKHEIAFLVGETLAQICLNPHNLDFRFENGIHINSEFAIEYAPNGGQTVRYDIEYRLGSKPVLFHHCIGEKIADVLVTDLRLSLIFESGDILHIESDIGPYESGQIIRPVPSEKEPTYFVF